jgi:uncharacterized protein YraI
MQKSALVLFLVIILSACGTVAVDTPPVPGQLETVVASTLSALTVNAPIPTVTFTPIPSLTPTEVTAGERYVYSSVDNLNLRVGPGALFKVSRVMPRNTRLKLLGRAPGSEWLNVLNDENINGWVYKDWVKGGFDGPPLPIVQPVDVILVTGKVVDSSASPVTGIGFAVTQGSRRTDASTDSSGQFYAYLPNNMTGAWMVEFISVDCTSNIMDANCKCIVCGKPDPEQTTVILPPTGLLNFVWK